ncbi:aminoglycoside phosphotransferase family protein [Jiangella anatolica]|uniref:Aminoglycoside phosphotransferase n=1 Tax=Jiangella anatolica TaxID=2670374 RepID=A0A2W2B5Y2_9ACTN|nr:aminoglycoside phosphotransferase family protein [Jiangella anatolica]PZF81472.1 aminoglycoside phosphotransferase [Jiangella anatolica]
MSASLGAPVVATHEQTGGMSPGCATRLTTAGGRRVFVKAVGASLQPDTPVLFRREIDVLGSLPPAPYRPALLGAYDDGDWVALLLEDVDGRPPDLADPHGVDEAAVRATVERQARELTPAPAGTPAIRRLPDVAERWRERWADLAGAPDHVLPPWTAGRVAELYRRVATLPERLTTESLCHWDVREDNLLIRPDGSAAIVDWGMACLGPSWGDAFVLALTWMDTAAFDSLTAALPVDPEVVTDLLLAFAGAQAWRGAQPEQPGLPTLAAFCRAEAARGFAGAHRRLGR